MYKVQLDLAAFGVVGPARYRATIVAPTADVALAKARERFGARGERASATVQACDDAELAAPIEAAEWFCARGFAPFKARAQ